MPKTRQLLLLRHGKSDWSGGEDDLDRPLSERGKRDAQRIGVWLATHNRVPDCVISSPATRAVATAEKACKAIGLGVAGLSHDPRIYAAGVDELMEVIRQLPTKSKRVLLVGHNPGLEELIPYLTRSNPQPHEGGKIFPTATLVTLQFEEKWSRLGAGSGALIETLYPRTLPKKFPWPQLQPQEQRIRPAYYYSQSAVVPYRFRKGRLEILIVRSSQRKHWVVPKGIHEPGLSARRSAAKEALEEAGAEGRVARTAIGHYYHEKWGASCKVILYPMAVERLIKKSEWEESYRSREWVTPQQAAQRMRQKELGAMILTLEKRLLRSVDSRKK